MCFKSFFQKPHYRSDISHFLEQLHQKNPQLEAQQKEGRNLLWDKNPKEVRDHFFEHHRNNLPHPAYKYYDLSSKDKR